MFYSIPYFFYSFIYIDIIEYLIILDKEISRILILNLYVCEQTGLIKDVSDLIA